MKKIFVLALFCSSLISCATYELTVFEDDGTIKQNHTSKEVFVGTDAFVLDAIINPFFMVYSLFVPTPIVSSSIGVNGGMNLKNYIREYVSLTPLPIISGGDDDWVIIDDENGNRHSYSGHKYKLEKVRNK